MTVALDHRCRELTGGLAFDKGKHLTHLNTSGLWSYSTWVPHTESFHRVAATQKKQPAVQKFTGSQGDHALTQQETLINPKEKLLRVQCSCHIKRGISSSIGVVCQVSAEQAAGIRDRTIHHTAYAHTA